MPILLGAEQTSRLSSGSSVGSGDEPHGPVEDTSQERVSDKYKLDENNNGSRKDDNGLKSVGRLRDPAEIEKSYQELMAEIEITDDKVILTPETAEEGSRRDDTGLTPDQRSLRVHEDDGAHSDRLPVTPGNPGYYSTDEVTIALPVDLVNPDQERLSDAGGRGHLGYDGDLRSISRLGVQGPSTSVDSIDEKMVDGVVFQRDNLLKDLPEDDRKMVDQMLDDIRVDSVGSPGSDKLSDPMASKSHSDPATARSGYEKQMNLKNRDLMEKKSIFTIAFDGIKTSRIGSADSYLGHVNDK